MTNPGATAKHSAAADTIALAAARTPAAPEVAIPASGRYRCTSAARAGSRATRTRPGERGQAAVLAVSRRRSHAFRQPVRWAEQHLSMRRGKEFVANLFRPSRDELRSILKVHRVVVAPLATPNESMLLKYGDDGVWYGIPPDVVALRIGFLPLPVTRMLNGYIDGDTQSVRAEAMRPSDRSGRGTRLATRYCYAACGSPQLANPGHNRHLGLRWDAWHVALIVLAPLCATIPNRCRCLLCDLGR
jgi:hypothetical protein